MNTKVTTKFPKMYICKYGIFYEGQVLSEYSNSGGHYYYVTQVVLDKFIVHYHNYMPKLYFRIHEVNKTITYTLPVDMLGIFYRKK